MSKSVCLICGDNLLLVRSPCEEYKKLDNVSRQIVLVFLMILEIGSDSGAKQAKCAFNKSKFLLKKYQNQNRF